MEQENDLFDEEPDDSNDPQELLYDSDADEDDEAWMKQKTENSDAVLSCPMCFTLLCLDCQRHVKYHSQFRAMFVENVVVSETRLVPQEAEEEVYYPVSCKECGTRVAVLDEDEVFHFFNVIESQAH